VAACCGVCGGMVSLRLVMSQCVCGRDAGAGRYECGVGLRPGIEGTLRKRGDAELVLDDADFPKERLRCARVRWRGGHE
jgi:hypothetical protein